MSHSYQNRKPLRKIGKRLKSPHLRVRWMEGSLFLHSISVCCSLLTSPLSFHLFFLLHTNTTVNFKLFLVHHKRGFFFFSLHGCQQQQIPVLKRCSVQVCCHKGFLLFFFKLFVLSHIFFFFFTFPRFQPPFPCEHRCCPEFLHNLADAVSSVLWWQEVKALWINASDSPPFFSHLFCFPPSGQTVFMLLDVWRKKKKKKTAREGTFTCCDVLVPGKSPKSSFERNRRWWKKTSDVFALFFFVFATETWAKRASTRLRGGSASVRREPTASPAEWKPGGCTLLVCVCVFCVHECVC